MSAKGNDVNNATDHQKDTAVRAALTAANSSDRLQAALTAGTFPDPVYIPALVERAGAEPDFFVRDMITWALTRHPSELTVPLLIGELFAVNSQSRSQALHTLSKIGDSRAWPAITGDVLHDADTDVARAAWRAAVILSPPADKPALALELAQELGRGDRATQLSLSRALIDLGDGVPALLRAATQSEVPAVVLHAAETETMWADAQDD
jgi:HEAT repeat protein